MPDRIVWTSPHGTKIDLTDHQAGYIVTAEGTRGLSSVAYAVDTDEFAGVDGVEVASIRALPNEPTLGLHLAAEDERDLRRRTRALVHAMRPQGGVGRLTVTTDWGEVRHLDCYCLSGLEGDEAPGVTEPGRWFRTVLKFYAPRPWWYGLERPIDVGLGTLPNFFPFFPMRLASSSVQGEFEVDLHDTDAEAFPYWVITGPGSELVLTNLTTGRSIEVETILGENERLVIDTRPGYQSVRRFPPGSDLAVDEGINEMESLRSDPSLWPLVVDVNRIQAQLVGATSASRIQGVYVPQYAGV